MPAHETEAGGQPIAPILELRAVSRRFGGLLAVNRLDLAVLPGSIHGLIGPNGSGKSTTFNVISGMTPATVGEVRFRGELITRLRPHQVARRGIARTFQATDLLPECSVLENLVVAAENRIGGGLWAAILGSPRHRRALAEVDEWANSTMALLRLSAHRNSPVRDLPHRDQKAVALANALATRPALLMLDEPAAGLTTEENDEMMDIYRGLAGDGLTILLVEHNMRTVMSLCQRITVLNHGVRIAEGTPEEIGSNPEVIEAYLGAQP